MTTLAAEDFDDTRVMTRVLLEMRGRRVASLYRIVGGFVG